MYITLLYFLSIVIMAIIFYFNKKEKFTNLLTTSVLLPTTSNLLPSSSSSIPSTSSINLTTSSSYDEMEEVDFSILDAEKLERANNSRKLSNCLSKFIGKKHETLRDVSEIMYSKNVSDCDNNIYKSTEYSKNHFDQLSFW